MSETDHSILLPPSAAVAEFHPGSGPVQLNAAALFNGFAPRPLAPDFTWAEFGCGHGITPCVQAAANPQGHFYGLDIDGKALNTGKTLAKAGFLANVTFLEADYTKPQGLERLPPLDFAVAHGVLSWLDVEGRMAFMARLRPLLKPGAILLATYDSFPGRAALVPLRDLLFSVTDKKKADPIGRARAAMEWLHSTRSMGARFFRDNPALTAMIDQLINLGPHHVARAFFGGDLRPLHFAQVHREMEAQGLTFAGRAEAHLNLVDLAVPEDMRKELRNVATRVELEAKRDFLRNEGFRRDIYVNGPSFPDTEHWTEAQGRMILGAKDAPGQADLEVDLGDQIMSFTGPPFDQVRAALDLGPRPLAELTQVAETEAVPPSLILEAARLLLAGGLAKAHAKAVDFPEEADPKARYSMPSPLNRILALSLGLGGPTVPLVSKVRGGGVILDNRDALLLNSFCEGGLDQAVARTLAALDTQGIDPSADRSATAQTLTRRLTQSVLPRLAWFLGHGIIERH
ncbi:methyltransferase regulatory domain-containing protein [Rhodospirillum sp. A1_3_36]|uniref:methyltransferase regulatory domain-containing protein n=1 Tax=Rhodospirillum sp. A1_3_36 TaxID=3391666 RepID=UPI0039A4A81B